MPTDIFDDVASPSTDVFDQLDSAPPKTLPKVDEAIRSVPRPSLSPVEIHADPLDPGDLFSSNQELANRDDNARRAAETVKPVVSPPIKATDVGKGLLGGVYDVATGGGMPNNMANPPLGSEAVKGVEELGTPGKRISGGLRLAGATTEALTPLMGPAALENPTSIVKGLIEGTVASEAGAVALKKAGVSQEHIDLAKPLLFWAPGVFRSIVDPSVNVASTEEGTAVGVGARGAKAGVKVTPEDVTIAGKVGPFQGSKTFQRGGQSTPAQPGIEPPTIEGELAKPTQAAGDMAQANAAEAVATKMAKGVPPTPPEPPGPAVPPDVAAGHISPETIESVTQSLAQLPPDLKAQGILEAHQKLSQVLQAGPIVVDGQLITVKTPQEADKTAAKIINDSISGHDKKTAEAQKNQPEVLGEEELPGVESANGTDLRGDNATGNRVLGEANPVPSNPENGATVSTTSNPTVLGEELLLKKGDKVTLPDGKKGTIKYISETAEDGMARVLTDDGKKVSVAASKLKPHQEPNAQGKDEPSPSISAPETGVGRRGKENEITAGEATPVPAESGAIPERRSNLAERKRVSEMSPQELQKELLTSPVTGIPNKRAFDEAPPASHVAMSDADGLKALNDKFGYEAGNELLRAKAQALKEAGLDAYHEKGDEFLYRGASPEELESKLEKARDILRNRTIQVEMKDGSVKKFKGADFSYGTGTDLAKAETGLKSHKSEREAKGERARGELRGITEIESSGSKVDKSSAVEPKFKFRSTQADISGPAAKALESARQRISDSDLAGKGKDVGGSHVTVRYGIKGDDVEGVRKYLKSLAPFEAKLGKTEKFPPSESSDGAAVIMAPVESPELHKINAELAKHGDFIEPTFEYKPHASISYVKPEAADKYVGMDVTHGKTFTIKSIGITNKHGAQEDVALEGKAEEAVKPKPRDWKTIHAEDKLKKTEAAEVKPGHIGEMPISELHLAPHEFQYKLSTDAEGVSTLLKDVKVFNPELADTISVWKNPRDGKFYVVNGHHRFELAKRTGTKNIAVRHIVADTAAEARAIGARQNIAQGRGTPIDAAKFFRDTSITPEDLEKQGMSLGEATARDGLALSHLDTSIFNKVVSGDLRQGRAIAIGEATENHAEQKAILDLVDKKENAGGKVTDDVLRELIRLVKGSGQTTETTADLFGSHEIQRSLALEKAEVSAHVLSQLSRDKKLFGFVAKEGRAAELARAGNKIKVGKSKEISEEAAQAEEVYNKLSERGGPISTILDGSAKRLAEGENAGTVKAEAYQLVRTEISKTLGRKESPVPQRLEKGNGPSLYNQTPTFYSKAARVAFDKLSQSGSGPSMLATLRNNGVKEDEIKWLGLDDFLKGKFHVKKSEVLSHILRNLVQVREVAKGKNESEIARLESEWKKASAEEVHAKLGYKSDEEIQKLETETKAIRQRINELRNKDATKYKSYTLPGEKKDYTELLLTLPTRGEYQSPNGARFTQEELADPTVRRTAEKVGISPVEAFRSSHFDEPNILAHVRFDTRTDADGKKVLFMEEVQSDWHQKGKRHGYSDVKDIRALEDELDKTNTERALAYADLRPLLQADDFGGWDHAGDAAADAAGIANGLTGNEYSPETLKAAKKWDDARQREAELLKKIKAAREGVPGAPFKSDWHELVAKRMLREAAEKGYDRLGWTTGEQQAARYDLSKQVRDIQYIKESSGDFKVWATAKDGGGRIEIGTHPATRLPDVVGKDIADRIIAGKGEKLVDINGKNPEYVISGTDLKVGGEWAKALYDRALPNFLSKYGKKWGTKVGDTQIGSELTRAEVANRVYGEPYESLPPASRERVDESVKRNQTTVHSIDITPEMKKSVLEDGQPLFKNAPLITDRSPQAIAKMAEDAKFEVIPAKGDIPKQLKVDRNAMQLVNRAIRRNFAGVNMGHEDVLNAVHELDVMKDDLATPEAKKNVDRLIQAFKDAEDSESGVILRPEATTPRNIAITHEELVHGAVQRATGSIDDAEFNHKMSWLPGMQEMLPRIHNEYNSAGLHPGVLVAEGAADLIVGTSYEISPKLAHETALIYYRALANNYGMSPIKKLKSLYNYVDGLAEDQGIIRPGEHFNADATEPARTALSRFLSEYGESGAGIEDGGRNVQESLQSGASDRSPKGGSEDRNVLPVKGGESRPTSGRTLASTQPVGLSDEELEAWAKSKGFRYEPAGEQLGMFGGNEQVYRVFRGSGEGKSERGLIYQSQLEKLNQPKASEIKPPISPDEPFELTGEKFPDEQKSLFGPGSLFKGESGSAIPANLGNAAVKAAGPIKTYIRDEIEHNAIARDLHSGMYDLESQHSAQVLRAVQAMQNANKDYGKSLASDAAKVYDHLENLDEPLTSSQDNLLDDYVLPVMENTDQKFLKLKKLLGQDAELIGNYVHRVVKGKRGWLDRIASGKSRGTGRGNLLSKSAPQTKGRTMMAIESPTGERRVISIKGGEVTMWQDGDPIKLGPIQNAKGQTSERNETFPEGQPNSAFFDEGKIIEGPDGYDWKITQATTKEIEANTGLEYYHNALASALVSNLQISKALRGAQFIEAFKSSPDFRNIAFKQGTGNPPDGWKLTQLPQLRDYYFEPHTAEVLDWYADRLKGRDPSIFDQIGNFLRTSIFFNPLIHIPNIAVHFAAERGVTGYNPLRLPGAAKAGLKAINAVIHQNQDFLDALDQGAALQSHREDTAKVTKLFFDQLTDGLEKKQSWALEFAKRIGMAPVDLVKGIYKVSGKITWVTNDIATLTSAYEKVDRGMPLKEALTETAKHIPDYRLPTRMLNSRALAQLVTNPNVSMFMAYHYGALKSYTEAAKSALGAAEPPSTRTKAGEVGHGFDVLAAIGLITFVLYPLLDKLAQQATGDKKARLRRAGASTLPANIQQLVTHQKSASDVLQSIVTPAAQTKAGIELAANRDLYTGKNIYDAKADWETQGHQIGKFLINQIAPVGQATRINEGGPDSTKKFLWGLVGISFPKSRAEKLATSIAIENIGTKAQDPDERDHYIQRRDILDALRKGDHKPLESAREKGQITSKQAHTLIERSHRTPLEDTVHGFSYKDVWAVYQAAKADGNQDEMNQLERVLRQKRGRMFSAGRGKEVTQAEEQ